MIKSIFLGIFLALFIAASSVNASFLGQVPREDPQCGPNQTPCWKFCCDNATEKCTYISWLYPEECRRIRI